MNSSGQWVHWTLLPNTNRSRSPKAATSSNGTGSSSIRNHPTAAGSQAHINDIALALVAQTAKPSAIRNQRLCLVPHTYRFLGRHRAGCRNRAVKQVRLALHLRPALPFKRGTPQSDQRKHSACQGALKLRSVDNSFDRLPGLGDPPMRCAAPI